MTHGIQLIKIYIVIDRFEINAKSIFIGLFIKVRK